MNVTLYLCYASARKYAFGRKTGDDDDEYDDYNGGAYGYSGFGYGGGFAAAAAYDDDDDDDEDYVFPGDRGHG